MKVNGVTKWIVINHQASSLFNVIADGVFEKTSVGKKKWLSLMDGLLLQYCDHEGFNVNTQRNRADTFLKVRIGMILGNVHYRSCYIYWCIGFGTSVRGCDGKTRKTTCGNIGICRHFDNKNTAAFGYIFVQ